MLYLVIAQDQAGQWISGVFVREEQARDYMREIPQPTRTRHKLQALELAFPMYALKDEVGFRFFGKASIVDALRALRTESVSGVEVERVILFRFDERYRPKLPGADEMGYLWHVHVTSEDLVDEERILALLI